MAQSMTPERRKSSNSVSVGASMRSALLLALLTFANGCTAVSGGTDEMTITTLGRGSSAVSQGPRTAILATSDAEYQRIWREMVGGSGSAPAVDFSQNVVVFLFAGQRNTGGWNVEPRGAAMDGDTLVVDAAVNGPGPDMIVTQALTYPYAVAAVRTRAVKSVRWP